MSNPYVQPGVNQNFGQQFKNEGVPTMIKAPAIALIVGGAINLLMALYGMLSSLMGANNAPPPPNIQENPQLLEFYNRMQEMGPGINIGIGLVSVLCAAVVVFGGVQMLRGKGFGLAVSASIISMIPCISFLGCCLIGQGIGIWSLIALFSEQGKRAFK